MLVVAAFESRRERGTVFSVETFNSPRMNKTAVVEIALAYLITQADFLNKLLGTKEPDLCAVGIGLTRGRWVTAAVGARKADRAPQWGSRKGGRPLAAPR